MIGAAAIAGTLLAGPPPTVLAWRQPAPPQTDIVDGRLRVRAQAGSNAVILEVPQPSLPTARFVLRARASGQVDGKAWLELLVTLAPDRQVAVRTRDTGGPLAYLKGEFRDREVEVPFASDPEHPPLHLTLSLVSEGQGTVEFEPFVIDEWRPLSLTWFAAGGFAMSLGIGLGVTLGAYALVAAIPNLRRTAYLIGRAMTVLGAAAVPGAGALYAAGTPSGIWIAVGVGGVFAAVVFGFTLPLVRRGILDADRRRADAGGALEPA